MQRSDSLAESDENMNGNDFDELLEILSLSIEPYLVAYLGVLRTLLQVIKCLTEYYPSNISFSHCIVHKIPMCVTHYFFHHLFR